MNIPQNEIDELAKKVLKQNSLIDAMNLIVFEAYKYGRKENESVLEDIKDEIGKVPFNGDWSFAVGIGVAMQIIESHISRKENDKMKVTCEIEDYSRPAMPSIRIHNGFIPGQVELEVEGKRYVVNAEELISAVNKAELNAFDT